MKQRSIEKCSARNDGILSVHSIFRTIQCAGPFCGTPAVFIRLAGCTQQCSTKHTSDCWNAGATAILELVREQAPHGLVVITGGEPFKQDIEVLLDVLTDAGYYVQIETNGTLAPPDIPYAWIPERRTGVYIVCNPKAGKVHPRITEAACCYMYVLEWNRVHTDGLPLQTIEHEPKHFVTRPPKNWYRPVYIQPKDNKDDATSKRNLKAAVQSCMTHGYILQLQMQKLIDME